MKKKYDIIIVGGGVLGTFHAFHALRQGLTVLLLEKNNMPVGATVQNFGQVVPSGMNQKWQNYGRESLRIYKEIQNDFDITIRQNGSVYIASNDEELQLLVELFAITANNGYASQLLTKDQCLAKYKGLKESYCKAGLFFPEEVTVEPRTMIHRLHKYMIETLGLDYKPNTTIINTQEANGEVEVQAANGTVFYAGKVIICSGNEFKTLYPKVFDESSLEISKLQMMQTKSQGSYKLDGSILTGWTIRRYESFTECPSWNEIKSKEDPQSFQNKYGVHILFKQAKDGTVILGDSHEYADAKNVDTIGFDTNNDIDDFMISEAKKIIDLPTYEIQNRWSGYYSQSKTKDIFEHQISPNVHIVTGIGGKGMTGSAGFSKVSLNNILK